MSSTTHQPKPFEAFSLVGMSDEEIKNLLRGISPEGRGLLLQAKDVLPKRFKFNADDKF